MKVKRLPDSPEFKRLRRDEVFPGELFTPCAPGPDTPRILLSTGPCASVDVVTGETLVAERQDGVVYLLNSELFYGYIKG